MWYFILCFWLIENVESRRKFGDHYDHKGENHRDYLMKEGIGNEKKQLLINEGEKQKDNLIKEGTEKQRDYFIEEGGYISILIIGLVLILVVASY